MSVARADLVGAGARRVALAATGIVAAAYLLIAVAVVLIVSHNLVSNIDNNLSQTLSQMAVARAAGHTYGGPGGGPPGAGFDTLWWMYHPDGNFDDSSATAKANNLLLPVSPASIRGPQDITIDDRTFRVDGGQVGDDWAVVAQSLDGVSQARSNIIQAELLIGPVLLLVVFLGALAIGRRVAEPVEAARRRQMDFTANASHELRTPLAVIQAQSSLALAQPRGVEWYQGAFQQVNRESQRMRHLVDDLLWLARLDAAADTQTPAEPVDLGVLAAQSADRFRAVAESRGQALDVQVPADAIAIEAPQEWIDRLLGVLIDNACRYTPEGGRVSVRVEEDGSRARLAVEDSGPGIPNQERERIFDRFHRASAEPGGSGLGLAIADAVVRATGGRWDLEQSTLGGASMSVHWPKA